MRKTLSWLFVLSLISFAYADLSMGWGDYDWISADEAIATASTTERPIFLLFWRSWCQACKNLMTKFADDEKLKYESSNFVMVNVGDSSSFSSDEYAPDGGYFPRILFLNPDGSVIDGITNIEGNPKYTHFYSTPEQIVDGMKRSWRQYNKEKLETEKSRDRSIRLEEL